MRAYLVERGVPRENDTAEGRATYRRVEIGITRPQAATGPTTAPPP